MLDVRSGLRYIVRRHCRAASGYIPDFSMCPRRVRGAFQRQRARGASLRAPKPQGQRRPSSAQGRKRRTGPRPKRTQAPRGLLIDFPQDRRLVSIPINPYYWKGVPISIQARNYSNYMVKSLQIHYVPNVSVVTAGSISFGQINAETVFDSDAEVDSALLRNGGVLTQCFKPSSYIAHSFFRDPKAIRGELNRTNNQGFLCFHRSAETPSWCGRFYLTYDVELTTSVADTKDSFVEYVTYGIFRPVVDDITMMILAYQAHGNLKPGTIVQYERKDSGWVAECNGSTVVLDAETPLAVFSHGEPNYVTDESLEETTITDAADVSHVVEFQPLSSDSENNGYARFTIAPRGLVVVQSINVVTGESRVSSVYNPYATSVMYDYKPKDASFVGYAPFLVEELEDNGIFDWIKVAYNWVSGAVSRVLSAAAGVASNVGQAARTVANAADYVARKADQFHRWAVGDTNPTDDDEFIQVTGEPGLLTIVSLNTASGPVYPTVTKITSGIFGSDTQFGYEIEETLGKWRMTETGATLALTKDATLRPGLMVIGRNATSDFLSFGFAPYDDATGAFVGIAAQVTPVAGATAFILSGYTDLPRSITYDLNNQEGIAGRYTVRMRWETVRPLQGGVPTGSKRPCVVADNTHKYLTVSSVMTSTGGEAVVPFVVSDRTMTATFVPN